MDRLWQDLRYGMRMLGKRPGFTFIAVLALALGIGANTAIFSVVNAVLLRPLPFDDSDQLALVWEKRMTLGRVRNPVSPPDFYDWRAQNTVFEDMAAIQSRGYTLGGGDAPDLIDGAAVTPSLFQVLRSRALHGRVFDADEDQPGKDMVAIISHGLWQRRFAADPRIINSPVTINEGQMTIVGVMPPDFSFPNNDTELWTPLALDPEQANNRGLHSLLVVARLKPDTTLEQAQADMERIAGELEKLHQVNTGHGVNVFSLYEEVVSTARPMLWILLGAVAFVLLIACANVANLLLARAASRQKEIAIRTALGAGRGRIIRQLLTESVMLALLGGTLGVLLALWGLDLLLDISPGAIPRFKEIGVDTQALLFTLAVSVGTGISFGLVPAIGASRPDLNETLKEGGRSSSGARRNRTRATFVIAQVAICLMLLIAAGLMARSFITLLSISPGFNPDGVLTMKVALSSKYREPKLAAAYYQQALEKIGAIPGVQSAGAALGLPLTGSPGSRYFAIEGRPPQPAGQGYNANLNAATPGYFKALGIPLLRGRDFSESDLSGAPEVAIINEEMARQFWPDEDALGKRILLGGSTTPYTIIGIVGDVKQSGLEVKPRQEMFFPYYQQGYRNATFAIRTTADPEQMTIAVRGAIQELDRDQPLFLVRTMDEVISESVSSRRFSMMLFIIFAVTALLLAVVGLYGVMSYMVAQRTHEIGIRMALGASSKDVLGMIVGNAMRLALVGIVIGLGAAFALTRLMENMLYEVKATDPLTFVVISILLALVAAAASYMPARRATRIDPMDALRHE
jgi:putative ABC transport system permease protein